MTMYSSFKKKGGKKKGKAGGGGKKTSGGGGKGGDGGPPSPNVDTSRRVSEGGSGRCSRVVRGGVRSGFPSREFSFGSGSSCRACSCSCSCFGKFGFLVLDLDLTLAVVPGQEMCHGLPNLSSWQWHIYRAAREFDVIVKRFRLGYG